MNFSNEKIIGKVIEIPNDDILPNRFQPRKYFDEEETLELADSIKQHGILQPIVVRQVGDKYEIIAGERRFKANILAGNDTIPAIVSNLDDKESSEIAVIENIQREDLTPIEEAVSYKRIIDMGYLNQEQLARKVGKSQSAIANKIRLLKLSDNVQDALMSKKISERHARSLLKLESLKAQDELLERIINERLTVRKTDEEINKMNNNINEPIINSENINNTQPYMNVSQPMNQPIINESNNMNTNVPVEQPVVTEPTMVDTSIDTEIPAPSYSPIMGTPINNEPAQTADTNVGVVTESTPTVNNDIQIPNQPNMTNNVSDTSISNEPISTFDTPINNSISNFESDSTDDGNTGNSNNLGIFGAPVSPTPVMNQQVVDNSVMNDTQVQSTINTPIEPVVDNTQPVTEITPNNNVENKNNTNFDVSNIYTQTIVPTQNNDVPLTSTFDFQPTESTNTIDSQPDTPVESSMPSFMPEQTTNQVGPTPVVDLSQPIQEEPVVQDTPLTNTIETTIQNTNEPIIVNSNDNQFDPIMPSTEPEAPTFDFKTIINLIRQCSQTIEKCGYKIDTEEYDLEGKYQVTFVIDKQ